MKNPVSDRTYIEIYNYEGSMVDKFEIPAGSNHLQIRTEIYKSGLYIIKARNSKNYSAVKKLIIQ